MKKSKVSWVNQKGEILWREEMFDCELPPVGRWIIWGNLTHRVESVQQNFDKGETEIEVETH